MNLQITEDPLQLVANLQRIHPTLFSDPDAKVTPWEYTCQTGTSALSWAYRMHQDPLLAHQEMKRRRVWTIDLHSDLPEGGTHLLALYNYKGGGGLLKGVTTFVHNPEMHDWCEKHFPRAIAWGSEVSWAPANIQEQFAITGFFSGKTFLPLYLKYKTARGFCGEPETMYIERLPADSPYIAWTFQKMATLLQALKFSGIMTFKVHTNPDGKLFVEDILCFPERMFLVGLAGWASAEPNLLRLILSGLGSKEGFKHTTLDGLPIPADVCLITEVICPGYIQVPGAAEVPILWDTTSDRRIFWHQVQHNGQVLTPHGVHIGFALGYGKTLAEARDSLQEGAAFLRANPLFKLTLEVF